MTCAEKGFLKKLAEIAELHRHSGADGQCQIRNILSMYFLGKPTGFSPDAVSTRLEYGMREMLFEARAHRPGRPRPAAKMGVDKREVEKIMNEGSNPSGALRRP